MKMEEGDQDPNVLRNFRLSKIRFKISSPKDSKNTRGGKAVWTFSKKKRFFFLMASPTLPGATEAVPPWHRHLPLAG